MGRIRDGYDLNGDKGGDVFTVGTTSLNAAATITIDPALASNPSLLAAAGSATSGPGDATNLAAMVATQSAPLSNGLDVQKGMAKIVSDSARPPLIHRTPPPSMRACCRICRTRAARFPGIPRR